jgi:hypothetical protein
MTQQRRNNNNKSKVNDDDDDRAFAELGDMTNVSDDYRRAILEARGSRVRHTVASNQKVRFNRYKFVCIFAIDATKTKYLHCFCQY